MKVIAQLKGGLGNQLFIYAAGRALARQYNGTLELDVISGFQRDHLYGRQFLLEDFGLRLTRAAPGDSFPGFTGRVKQRVMRAINRAGLAPVDWCFVDEKSGPPAGMASKVFLRGHWQSESHFAAIRNELRAELAAASPVLQPETAAELQAIEAEPDAVGVCLRSFAEVPQAHGPVVMAPGYYAQAVVLLRAQLRSPRFFLFSDNPEWARGYLNLDVNARVIAPKTTNLGACQDLALMRACRHLVIGNGTLHWWGAWMAREEGKTVVVPSAYANTHRGFYPPNWISL